MAHYVKRILEKGQRLRLSFEDGSIREVDLITESKRGPAYKMLSQPDFVSGVRRTEGGHILTWPNGMTWSCDVVWSESKVLRPGIQAGSAGNTRLLRGNVTERKH